MYFTGFRFQVQPSPSPLPSKKPQQTQKQQQQKNCSGLEEEWDLAGHLQDPALALAQNLQSGLLQHIAKVRIQQHLQWVVCTAAGLGLRG